MKGENIMTIGEVLEMLESIFKFLMSFFGDFFNKGEDTEETTEAAE